MVEPSVGLFGGGCFWCTDAVFRLLRGVLGVVAGYAGGIEVNPTYEEISRGDTQHVEVVRVEFDAARISFRDLLTVFFTSHDPTSFNKQGADVGSQYASVIFYFNEEQKRVAQEYIHELDREGVFERPIVTRLVPFSHFYKAEDYHQDYYRKNAAAPYCQVVIGPKITKLHERFEQLVKKE